MAMVGALPVEDPVYVRGRVRVVPDLGATMARPKCGNAGRDPYLSKVGWL
jgi:hypothetical protein